MSIMNKFYTSLRIGCCGFARGMKQYFKTFGIVELQQTFYQLPTIETAMRWKENAPDDFEFCVKAWQGITHPASSPTYKRFKGKLRRPENYGFFQQTDEVLKSWEETEKICSILKAKYVLFQSPSSFKPTDENIENIVYFFKKIRKNGFCFVWEPRGKEWLDSIVQEVCKKCDLIHCVDPFAKQPVTRDFAYFRLHGKPPGKKMYYYDYSEDDLNELLRFFEVFNEVYCFFNNVNMYENAVQLIKKIKT